uniref:Uncharacterized protein n=2 Tax=Picea TaxID=3328 RepID=A0A101LZD6_PICGL|nr:hypothetical protein ABT39_MTgene5178 [Picea glauca]QHR91638.1 hypothetical protein Q903MT_gene5673 [Picea sitchensis]
MGQKGVVSWFESELDPARPKHTYINPAGIRVTPVTHHNRRQTHHNDRSLNPWNFPYSHPKLPRSRLVLICLLFIGLIWCWLISSLWCFTSSMNSLRLHLLRHHYCCFGIWCFRYGHN